MKNIKWEIIVLISLIVLVFLAGYLSQNRLVLASKPQNSGGIEAEVVIIAPPVLTSSGNPNLDRKLEKSEIIELIYYYSNYYGVNFSLTYELAKFESNFNPTAKSPKSTAKGIYQFLDKTWIDNCEGNVYNAEDNIKCAIRIISEDGLKHWTADKNVAKYLTLFGFIK